MMEISQPAYLLHSRPYRETSILATLLTPEYGKVNAVIRGVRSSSRKGKTQKGAILQPFQKVLFEWREKPNRASDLISIRAFEAMHLRFPLEGESSFCGLYLNELLYRLLYGGVSVDALFSEYEQALFALLKTQTRNEQAWVLRQFEFQLLESLGLNLNCEMDAHNQTIIAERDYHFYPEIGAVPAEQESAGGSGVLISGACLQRLVNKEYCEPCLLVWKRLLRQVLSLYLGNKPILARQLFK
ncbi:DNA repair protein RecO [Thiomicrorhabdus chilensis]|uniref:DNA repair protein RecO n=1 Tax=Thiomicrorhabdus chilensis TaxID=63656 RepID=UPI0003FB1F6D|nr:DNA repair protein RecO [Thiomicrorhabdus chilensis]